MRSRFKTLPVLVVIFSLLFTCSSIYAASIKDRMAGRIPAINSLKDQGVLGESNQGLLDYPTAQKPDQAMVQAENSDRSKVYAAIGKKQGVSPALVGQRRAKMIADKGKKGQWFQSANGKWYKK